jgi:prolipoprotein diacylglyceryl transferase
MALLLYSYRHKEISWIRLLDLLAIPAALAAACIRIGNFINQEVLGTPTNLPWAVTFGHPADGSLPIPRHPVQLYEALCYLLLFGLLWGLARRSRALLTPGLLSGLFLLLAFVFRFGIEALKVEQSRLLSSCSTLSMGQILSLPVILFALALLLFGRRL